MNRLNTFRPLRAALCTAVAVLALTGCTTGVFTNSVNQSGYDTSLIGDVARRGGMPLEVKGQPFPGDSARFAEIAARALTEDHPGPAFTVFADPGAAPEGPMRTVIVANPETPVTPANACTAQVTGTPVGSGGTLGVTAALCRGDKAVTRMTGRAVGVAGVDDPKVDRLFRQIAREVYPRREEDREEQEIWMN